VSNRKNLVVLVGALSLLGASSAFAAKKDKEKEAQAAEAAANDPCGVRKISKKVDKPMSEAEKAFNAKNWDEVLAKVTEAEAVPVEKTLWDQYWIHEFRGRAYLSQEKYAEAAKELEPGLASPCMDAADKPARARMLLQIAYRLKEYPKVIEVGNKYLETNKDPDIASYVGNAYYAIDDFPNARRVMADVVAQQEATSKPPEELTYRILQGACIKLKDTPCVTDQLEKLVIHYPKQNYWQDLMSLLMAQTKNNNQLLNMWRLADANDAVQDPAEFLEFAQLAIGQGLPGEAQAVIEKGLQKGVFTRASQKEQANQILAEAKQAVALDKSTLEKQDAAARAKPTGDNDVKLGAAYLSYGDPAKAIEAIQRGVAKGGVKNADDAGLLLGIAQLRAGNKPEAAKAFQTVSKDPTMTRIAKLWLLET
jgi:tetratricopeptide (TPR) repeat protein